MSGNSKAPYVSVIKINGQPILPPLITPELRKELLDFKKRAIEIEKLLKNCSDLHKQVNVEELLESQSSTRPTSEITFGDNSHIEALNISEKPKVLTDSEPPHNNNQCLILIDNQADFGYRSYSDFPKPSTPPRPRLIRSKSYTLDSPSPILLEHLKKASEASFIDEANETRPSTMESAATPSPKLRRSSTFSISPSQSLYYSLTSDNDTKPELGLLQEKNGYWEGYLMHNSGCNRELFPPETDLQKKEWAASVIGAHIKGFLTRRLLKTEKVQALIATVKDVLGCALELHYSDNIDEKDVEFHRRLINQLSAALYTFHDVFFELSTQEQMAVIAADRQRRIEKASIRQKI